MDEIGGISSDGRRLCYIIELFIPLILKRRMNIDIITYHALVIVVSFLLSSSSTKQIIIPPILSS